MDAAPWAQDDPTGSSSQTEQERKVRPKVEQALNCPRCHSTNTKFCYYNNYSLTQPRYFCKACKRYWTAGGSLRNIPVGGASRKNNKRSSSSTIPMTTSSTSSKPTQLPHFSSSQNPNPNTHKGQDLNLAFQPATQENYHHGFSQFLKINSTVNSTTASSSSSSSLSDLLRNGISSSALDTPTPMPAGGGSSTLMYNNALGFNFQEFNPAVGFAIDHGNGIQYEGYHHHHHQGISSGGRIMLPFEALTTREGDHQTIGKGNSNGFWNGMLGGGSC